MRYVVFLFMLSSTLSIISSQEFLIKDRGDLNFFSSRKILNFEIDLISYYENALEIKNATDQLDGLCKKIHQPSQCKLFLDIYEGDWKKIQNNINYIKNVKKRRNRRWAGFAWKMAKFAGKFLIADLAISAVSWSVTEAMEKNKGVKTINATSVQDIPKLHQKTAEYNNQTEMANVQFYS